MKKITKKKTIDPLFKKSHRFLMIVALGIGLLMLGGWISSESVLAEPPKNVTEAQNQVQEELKIEATLKGFSKDKHHCLRTR